MAGFQVVKSCCMTLFYKSLDAPTDLGTVEGVRSNRVWIVTKQTPKTKTPIRVLLLEDVRTDAELSVRELKRAGLRTQMRVVSTEEEFREELAGFAPDVILSDFSMPGFDGMFALSIARELCPEVPFIFVSGTIGEEYAIRALQSGAIDYVMKANLVRLPAAVERAMQNARERVQLRHVERALKESEAGLRHAQLMAGLAHVVTGPDGVFETWSESLPQLIGVAPAQMPASTREWLKLLHPEDRAQFRATSIEAGRRGARMSIDYRLKRADGAWIHIRQEIEPLEGGAIAQGKSRWFNTLQDVTAQKQAAEALRESEARHRAMFEQAAVGIVHTSLDGDLQMVNPKFCEISGYTRAEAIQLNTRVLISPVDMERSLSARSRMLAGAEAPYEWEPHLLCKDGAEIWVHVTTSLVRAADGRPSYFITVLDDISERKRAEEELRRFKLALDNSADTIFIVDRTTMRNVDVNQAACRLLGYTRAELLQMGPQDILPFSRSELEKKYDAMIANPSQPSGMRSYYRCKDDSQVPFESTRQAIRSGNTWLITAISRDIRERLAAETALRESEARFRSLSELSSDWFWQQDAEHRFAGFSGGDRDGAWGSDQLSLLGLRRWELPGVAPVSGSWDQHKAVLEARKPFRDFEYQRRLPDGALRYVTASGEPVFDAGGRFTGYRGVATDITERKRAEQELLRFQQAMDVSVDSIYLTDPSAMRFVYLNTTACQRLGYEREQLLQMGPQDVLPMSREQIGLEYDAVIAAGDKGLRHERRFVRSDGSEGWTELHRQVLRTEAGTLIVTIGRDITERKEADDRIRRLNRVYAVLSGINAAIVRVGNRDELFQETCRIAVELGGFGIAQILLVDEDTYEVWPGPNAGMDKLPVVRASFRPGAETISPQGTTIRAIRERKAVFTNDITAEPPVGALRTEALRRGYGSVISLPLMVREQIVAVLLLNAKEKNFFNEEELQLLGELAGDVSFALDNIEKKERLDYLAFYDQLTGLANRPLFLERLNQSIHFAVQAEGKFAVAILDLERLRTVNESLGRRAGDALLKLVAKRLNTCAGALGAARISADHFALVLGEVKGRSQAGRIVSETLQKCFGEAFQVSGTELRLAAKAGVALYPGDGAAAETLLENAEAALRRAKELGERHVFYTAALTERTAGQLTLENQLRQALEKEEFVLHYQPKVDLETRAIMGVEALIRWQSPTLGLVPPMQFIPLLEETGLILDAGSWALKQASLDHRNWVNQGLMAPRVAVNVSPIQLRQRDFVAAVERAIMEGVAPTGIDLEITESLIMEDIQGSIEKLKTVRGLGVRIAIDDFGTGYSSLGYLAKLPVQTLKIDRSFIITMLGDPDTMTLVSTIISLAHSLRLKVVAEGVDAEEQAKVLRLLRCDEMQGYLFSKPIPYEQMTEMLKREKKV